MRNVSPQRGKIDSTQRVPAAIRVSDLRSGGDGGGGRFLACRVIREPRYSPLTHRYDLIPVAAWHEGRLSYPGHESSGDEPPRDGPGRRVHNLDRSPRSDSRCWRHDEEVSRRVRTNDNP
jgi:hypothetical protein